MFLLQNRSLTCVSARTSYRSVTVQQVRPVTLPRPCSSSPLYARVVTRSASESSPGAVNNSSGAVEGQMSVALMEAMQAKIQEALEAERVVVSDVYGDGRHVNINVVSAAFEGKSSVQRQRLVYKAIWLELQDAVHAVDAMTTKTPAEAASA